MVSHELRTPLNAIVGWAQLLRNGTLDAADARKAVETIDRNAHSQSKLISDLLDISRILSGKLLLEDQLVALETVAQDAVEAIAPTAVEKGVALRVAPTAAGPPLEVVGDASRLEQVLLNLLTNAIKFTPPGGRIEIDLRRDGENAVVSVKDSGKGIDPPFVPHVFDRFRQADASTTRKHGGLGLGLAIVRHLVELHRGHVQAESLGPDQGATFRIWLPLARSAVQPSRLRMSADLTECVPDLLKGRRVLVVDDEPDTLELLTYSLRQCGAYVATAASVAEALRAFKERPFDLLISDIGMPDQDGYALIRAIRRLPAEAGGQIPAVAVTAFVGREDREMALAAGFQEHVAKPIKPTAVARLVADLIPTRPSS
jgi:CheY-like chemotaxis protein